MRLSTNEKDPGYHPLYVGAKVFVNGSEVSHVRTADEEQGLAYRAMHDEQGNIVIDRATEEFVEEVLRGEVRIEIEPEKRARIERDHRDGFRFAC